MLLMLAFFFKNPLSVKNAFLMPAQLPDAYLWLKKASKTNVACFLKLHRQIFAKNKQTWLDKNRQNPNGCCKVSNLMICHGECQSRLVPVPTSATKWRSLPPWWCHKSSVSLFRRQYFIIDVRNYDAQKPLCCSPASHIMLLDNDEQRRSCLSLLQPQRFLYDRCSRWFLA